MLNLECPHPQVSRWVSEIWQVRVVLATSVNRIMQESYGDGTPKANTEGLCLVAEGCGHVAYHSPPPWSPHTFSVYVWLLRNRLIPGSLRDPPGGHVPLVLSAV